MTKKYKVVIFDVDGTLLNTSEGIISSAKYAINAMGYKVPSQEILESFIGPPIQDSFAKIFRADGEDLKKMANFFRNQYKENDLLKAVPYNGIYDVFEWLQQNNFHIAIATYKRQDYAETIVKHFGFDKYTNIICGSDFAGKLRKNDIIINSMQQAKIKDTEHAVMIGDSNNDAEGADIIGMDFIGVTYGFGFASKNDLVGKNNVGVAETPMEIIKVLSGAK